MNTPVVVAVTKKFPFEVVQKSVKMGYTHIGENRTEEAAKKIELARQNSLITICWHMIGHVQSRKIHDVVTLFDRVDSVDSVGLLEKLDSAAGKIGKKLRVLLEVNISGEKSKYGFIVIPNNLKYSNLSIEGLMTMAPYTKNPEDNRIYFKKLRELSEKLRETDQNIGTVLSMGTSCDYTVAIEEGATEVRLGEALFGPRQ